VSVGAARQLLRRMARLLGRDSYLFTEMISVMPCYEKVKEQLNDPKVSDSDILKLSHDSSLRQVRKYFFLLAVCVECMRFVNEVK